MSLITEDKTIQQIITDNLDYNNGNRDKGVMHLDGKTGPLKSVYLFSGWFTPQQVDRLALMHHNLMENPTVGNIYLPMAHQYEGSDFGSYEWGNETFNADVRAMDNADMGIGIVDTEEPDTGSAWEAGYMRASHKPVIVHVGKSTGEDAPNLMIVKGADLVLCDEVESISVQSINTFNLPMRPYKGNLV